MLLLVLSTVFLLSPSITYCQFPAICNTQINLDTKTCCPNNCGGSAKGTCKNVTAEVADQYQDANSIVREILRNAPNEPEKGTADSRYLWPTVVFENVCECSGNYGGIDCTECNFGWTGSDCNTKKTPVIRRSFSSFTPEEKERFVTATMELKNEMGFWSVVVEEPPTYTSGTVTLQNVSTYDFFVYVHNIVARDETRACTNVDNGNIVDFAHSGPVFPVWHRRYILIVEKEFQRIMNDDTFGLPYWQWEENDISPFTEEYYGEPSNVYGPAVDVIGTVINSQNWNMVCDLAYRNDNLSCSDYWKPCNPANDLEGRRGLQRGGQSTYLPNVVEVMIALAAPSYDAPNLNGDYLRDDPRTSFRSRLEGWNIICSAVICTGPKDNSDLGHMHNNVHDWVRGQMGVVSSAINDPIFNLHHCNVDRILESWMKRFTHDTASSSFLLPPYVPVSGGHPGHNGGDYMVPFLPLIKASEQYSVAENWGYTYDSLIPAGIPDSMIPDCSTIISEGSCPICDANATCIDCTSETCPEPGTVIVGPSSGVQPNFLPLGLGLGLGLGLLLLIAVVIIIVLSVVVCKSKLQRPLNKVRDTDSTVKT